MSYEMENFNQNILPTMQDVHEVLTIILRSGLSPLYMLHYNLEHNILTKAN